MISREDILSAYKQSKFPDKLFDESIQNIKTIIFYQESTKPSSKKEKDKEKLSESYVLPRRILMKKQSQPVSNEFFRGGNFTKKEPVIDIKIDNFKLIYDKFSLPVETNVIYIKNTYGGINGPYNLENINNMYKNKKIDSNNNFRLIDIFSFKDSEFFSFQSLRIINDEKWIDLIVDNPLINYSNFFKNKKNQENNEKKISNENKENAEIESKTQESTGAPKKKKKKVKSKEIKEEKEDKEEKEENKKEEKDEKVEKQEEEKVGKKEEKKNNTKEEMDSEKKLEIKINNEKKENNEELVEMFKRKKMEKEKRAEEEKKAEESKKEEIKAEENKNEDNGNNEDKKEGEIKTIKSKKSKKSKKAKKGQFEETEIDLGFQVK